MVCKPAVASEAIVSEFETKFCEIFEMLDISLLQ